MKDWTVLLLAAISAGVPYLAWTEYDRQHAADAADPAGYVARQWADNARIHCNNFHNVRAIHSDRGYLRPMSFTCWTGRNRLAVNDVECPDDSYNAPVGQKTPDGLYKPFSSICWSVTPLPKHDARAAAN